MTNREMLIMSLQNKFDDWAANESNVAYGLNCPYYEIEGHPCEKEEYPFNTLRVCGPCKMEWLNKEVSE